MEERVDSENNSISPSASRPVSLIGKKSFASLKCIDCFKTQDSIQGVANPPTKGAFTNDVNQGQPKFTLKREKQANCPKTLTRRRGGQHLPTFG